MKNIQILYEDEFLLILNKPAGLAVQGGEGIKSSLDKILAEIRAPAPLLVHRLDRDTSGVLVTAKGKETASRFSRLFTSGNNVIKQYTAVCCGCPEKKEGEILQELNIRGSKKNCKTKYRLIKKGILSNQEYSVLEIELGTGRMHQIRRHLAMIGNPVIGDDKYGDFSINKKLRKEGVKRLLLHASRLIINEEFKLDISSPVPEYFHPFT